MTEIAKDLGVGRSTLLAWLASDKERAQRSMDARRLSAAAFDDMALQLLLDAKDAIEVTRAREIASHLRWRASKMDVAQYGNKVGIGGAPGLPPIDRSWSERTPEEHIELARRMAFILAQGEDAMRNQPAALPQLAYTPAEPKPDVRDWWPHCEGAKPQ